MTLEKCARMTKVVVGPKCAPIKRGAYTGDEYISVCIYVSLFFNAASIEGVIQLNVVRCCSARQIQAMLARQYMAAH